MNTGLSASTYYYYKVEAQNSEGKGEQSLWTFAVTNSASGGSGEVATKPGRPTGVTATAQNSSSIKITWSAPTSGGTPTRYNILRSSSSSGSYTEIGNVSGTTYSYTDTGLSASTVCYYRVQAQNSEGKGEDSLYVSATTSSASGGSSSPPGAPTSPKISLNSGETGFLVTWTAPSTGAYSYNVYRSTSGGSPTKTSTYVNSFNDTSVTLTYGNSYSYYIKAVNSSNTEGSASATVSVTIPKVKVRAYKPASSGEVISASGIFRGGIIIGSTTIEAPSGSASGYSSYIELNPGSYKLQYGYSASVGSSITYKELGNITLKPFHTYDFSVYNGSTKADTVNFVYN